jgi:transposase InsO family protein
MSVTSSPSTGKFYGLQRVCRIWGFPRSTVYAEKQRKSTNREKLQRGPKSIITDQELIGSIRKDLNDSPFRGEGHRKVHARLRHRNDLKVSRERIRRLMGKEKLLSPYRAAQGKANAHDGRITTDAPDVMWATDAAKILTVDDGWVWFFGILEHWNAECLGWHLSKKGDRFAAIDALAMGLRGRHGSVQADVAQGLKLRMDHGSQFTADHFLQQVRYWGISPSFGFVKEPETNGVVERFHRTLKEQVIHGRIYKNIEELRRSIQGFIEAYNRSWILEKLGYKSPQEARTDWEAKRAVA